MSERGRKERRTLSSGWLAAMTFVAACGFYLLFAGQVSATELAACIPAAAALAAFVGLQHRGQAWPIGLWAPWPRIVLKSLLALLRDTARVGPALLRAIVGTPGGITGTIERQPFRAIGDRPDDAGRRAIVTLASSFAPNCIVLDVAPSLLHPHEQLLLVHRLLPSAPEPDAEWPV